MAIVSKTNPKGVDYVLDAIQQYLYPNLLGLGWTNYEMYPRANKNAKGNSIIAEISTDPKDYQEVLFNDKFNATSFFLVDDRVQINNEERLIVQNASIIFQLNLPKLYPLVTTHRADEEAHANLTQLLTSNDDLFVDVDGYVTTVEQVYSDLSIRDFSRGNLSLDDMSQFHVVRYDFTVTYGLDDCQTVFSPTCDPASISINGENFAIVPSGGTFDVPVEDTNLNPVGFNDNGVWRVPAGGSASIDVDVNGVNYVTGQTSNIDIPVVDTIGNGVGTVNAGVNVEIADHQTTINGASLTANKAETNKSITIRYADNSPVTVTTVFDVEKVFIGEVPNVQTPLNTANLYVTGQTASYRTGDDPTRGRGSNFYTLNINTPWNHPYRFVGTTGGYTDGTNYFDVNGVATTKTLAFPNDECCDWAYWDQVSGELPMWYLNPFGDNVPTAPQTGTIGGKSWTQAIDESNASTQNGRNDWHLPNSLEIISIVNWNMNINSDQGLNYPPFSYGFSGFPTGSNWRIWTSTGNGVRAVYFVTDNGSIATSSISTASYTYFIKRTTSVTELGL